MLNTKSRPSKCSATSAHVDGLLPIAHLVTTLLLAMVTSVAFGQQAQFNICGSLQNAYGPFDYRTEQVKLQIVEAFHFTAEVETLIAGKTGRLVEDLDYTLRAAPNHHRALVAMMRLGEREKTNRPYASRYSVDCYFERAIRFAPNDTVARGLYATFLIKAGKIAEATAQVEYATSLAGDSGFAHYNIGLIYLEMKKYDQALSQAHRALALGFTRPALIDGLKQAGAWREPEPSANDLPASAAASAPKSAKP